FRVGVALADPLQRVATIASTFLLQTIGLPAVAERNTILLNEAKLDVVTACSGLRMLVIFFALATAVALLIRRPIWEKCLVVASAAPIALASNVVRITVTGILQQSVGAEAAKAVFHDLAGWLMMPLALALLGLELRLLDLLFVEPSRTRAPSRLVAA